MVNKKEIGSLLIVTVFLFTVIGFLIWCFAPRRMFHKERYNLGVYQENGYQRIAREFQRVERVDSFDNLTKLWKALKRGQIDGALVDRLQGLAAISSEYYGSLKPAGRAFHYQLQAAAFRADEFSLCQAIDQGLENIIGNQIFRGISEDYFGRDTSAEILSKINFDQQFTKDGSWGRIQHRSRLRLAFPSDNPPFSYIDADKKLTGFDVEVAWAISIQLGIRYFQPVAVKNLQISTALNNQQIDGIWGVPVNPGMKSKVIYSSPYRISGPQLFVRKDSPILGPEYLVPPVYPELPPGMKNTYPNLTYR